MMARSTGAFLVTLVALGYLLGDLEGTRDLLIVLLISAGVGVATGYWLERDEAKAPPDVFDERATRRAVRRGVVRTALTAVVWAALGWIGVSVVTGIWQMRGDRSDRFQTIARYGFNVANPGFRPAEVRGCCAPGLRSIELELRAEPRTASTLATPATVPLSLDLRGRLEDVVDLPTTPVDVAASGAAPKPELRRLLDRLPEPLVATAVVELADSAKPPAFYALLARHGVVYPDSDDVPVYLQPHDPLRSLPEGHYFDDRVSWSTPALAGFQHWVKQLRGDDDRLLDGLQLPPTRVLREIAADPRIFGFVLERATPTQLRRLLADPAIKTLSIGDVAFDLGAAK